MQDRPVALVTGANKGIGLETVRRLIGAGHRVYLASRDIERGRAAAETVGARPIQLDVTSDDSVRHAAEIVEQEEGVRPPAAHPFAFPIVPLPEPLGRAAGPS